MARRQNMSSASTPTGHRPDYILAITVLALIGIGLVMIYSTGAILNFYITGGVTDKNVFFSTQLMVLLLGLVLWYISSRIHYSFWRKIAPYFLIFSIALMLIASIPGLSYSANGATRWLKLGPISFQPVELFKLSLVFYLSGWIDKNKDNLSSIVSGLVPYMLITLLAAGFVMVAQRDMGSAMVIVSLSLGIYFLAGGPLWIFGVGLSSIVALAIAMIYMFPYRLARLRTFFNHQEDPSGSGYHIKQALIAIGSGGLIGRGLGNSYQSYGYLPESTNDSIYAIIGEQFGLIGTLTVIAIFALLAWRGLRIAKHAPDTFSRLVAAGITFWIVFQALINITAMLNLIPLTGVPLPYISYGGTSLLISMIAIGVLQNISRFTFKEVNYANRSFGRGQRRTHRTNRSHSRQASTVR